MLSPLSKIKKPLTETIVDLFIQQVEKTPDQIAIVYKEQKLTYKELNTISNQLAHYLISEKNVVVSDLVGIMQSRSEMLIVCILGILKSGAAYVPIDQEYPEQRISYLQNDCNCKFTLDQNSLDYFLASKEKYAVTAPTSNSLKPNDLAYIIYTSGSTGYPKGVMIEHRNLINYLLSISDYIDINSNNSGCFTHLSISFDASITEIFLPLIMGKKLILSSGTGLEIFDDINLFNYAPYDFIKLTPSQIRILISVINNKNRPKLATKYIIGGEALFSYHIDQFRSANIDAIIVNEYGPTEATVGCSVYEFNTFDTLIPGERIPIGKPISNTQMYLLDENRQLSQTGEVGEIYIAGNGLARGYFNSEELNSKKFCINPFNTKNKMYGTGDKGKWLPDGNLIYFGRIDEQVKINGYRIELFEIESALITIPQIKQACVVMNTNSGSEPRLIAYLQPIENGSKHPNVREALAKIVPNYMIPNIFMWVNDFPLTSNGKIDKKALLTEEYINIPSTIQITKPRTKSEKFVADVWKESLNLEDIDVFSNFFEIGGQSIIAFTIVVKIQKKLDIRIPFSAIFQNPTIEKFAKLLNIENEIETDFFGIG